MPGRPVTPARALFGKLPAHGDFVRRGEAALVQRLDAWLTGEVERIAAGSDGAYEDRLAALPVWCFVLAGGQAGALAGSRDRVGRIFPVVALASGGDGTARAAARLLERAGAGTLDADDLFKAADWPGPGSDAATAPGWWRSSSDERAGTAHLPTGADFDRLLDGAD